MKIVSAIRNKKKYQGTIEELFTDFYFLLFRSSGIIENQKSEESSKLLSDDKRKLLLKKLFGNRNRSRIRG